MTSEPSPPPRAFSGSRLAWADLPRTVRTRIATLAGSDVISETSATSGFSPGYASLLELGSGTRLFVKAVSAEQNPESPVLARAEARVAALLPPAVSAPALRWWDDDGTWVILAFEAVEGRSPEQPWRPEDLDRVLAALTDLAAAGTPAPDGLRSVSGDVEAYATGWASLAADDAALDRAVAAVGPHGAWLRAHLPEIIGWCDQAPAASAGTTLVHGDLRADNVMLGPDRVWLIDWPHATVGARWFDLLGMLPSVAMQNGGDPDPLFWAHPNAVGADRDAVRAVLAALTGYFVHGAVQPPPLGIANLRAFQLGQGIAALSWLREL
ncbi:phosphotransferase family protein [Cellulomonas sp. KRMCY2]|uniref:phosphotransferase family protein n=1 Tax=Cellulomonas sp. KRMCY2 TaxID=1304865 RepID=UPI00045EB1C2|nr:phosphotransferase [Cellulomonas sp. KRMCY2]